MFKRAIVRRPGKSMVGGITTAGLGKPDHGLALVQHEAYVEALKFHKEIDSTILKLSI